MVITQNEIGRLENANAYDRDGDKIGSVGQVYLDAQSGEPEWVTVKTGLFGTKESFVPLRAATFDGDRLVVTADKAKVKDAPSIETDRALSFAEEHELYRYYGLTSASGEADTGSTVTDDNYTGTGNASTGDNYAGGTSQGEHTEDRGSADRGDAGGSGGQDSMTRSEERLATGTRTEETGKARLRKYVVTEQQQVSVPVSREEVRLEREPITDANAGDALDGPAITESEHEVTLHAERPVVNTEAVPVERVRLGKETVQDEESVTGEVRKEQIDYDGPDARRNH
jgi:uncharacterized protein (TIGR02271 family)